MVKRVAVAGMEKIKISALFAFTFLITAKCERLHEQIYSSIEGGAACFRRLNGTHQAGCSSSDKGAVGVVHMISSMSDAEWLAYNASETYMAVVSTSMFHGVVKVLIRYPEHVAGMLLYENSTAETPFSQESRCPNEYASAPDSQCSSAQAGGIVWNDWGTGLLRRDIPFPIFYLPDSRKEEVEKIEVCYKKFNLDRNTHKGASLCSLQLTSFMFAAVNTQVCMRRSAASALSSTTKVCDPLGDRNIYYSLFPRVKNSTTNKKQVTLVTARIDTASLFDGISPGAASSVVGMTTLISAAAALAQMIPATDAPLYNYNVLWTLLNGESFDYIGSQRLAYDLLRTAWPPVAPLSPADIRLHLEVGQLGGSLKANSQQATWPLYAFTPTNDVTQVTEILQIMSSYANQNNMTVQPKFTSNLPPSSLHSFRRILKNVTETGELPEVLLVDHDDTFTNMYYNSALDEANKIGFAYHNISIGTGGAFIPTEDLIKNGNMTIMDPQVKISNLATAIARTLYQHVVGQAYTGNASVSAHLVDEMLYCFLQSQACRLLLAADYAGTGNDEVPSAKPAPLYVGVAAWANAPAAFAGHLIALLTGTHRNETQKECNAIVDPDYSYYWLRGWNHSGICVQTTMNFSQAVSPAFTIQNYDYTSGEYSTWTESVWQTMWARVFVSASGQGARAAAIAGGISTLVAAILTLWLRRHAAIVFIDAGSVIDGDAATGILRGVNC